MKDQAAPTKNMNPDKVLHIKILLDFKNQDNRLDQGIIIQEQHMKNQGIKKRTALCLMMKKKNNSIRTLMNWKTTKLQF